MYVENTTCQTIMLDFACHTGLIGERIRPRRYLWTDAFAVCNYLELFQQTNDQTYLQLAIALVDNVHSILGKHRDDSTQHGWLSGLNDTDALQHPTLGGLRIGKTLNERQLGEPADAQLEWDQDGQYYHYLTQWMHALNCLAQVSQRVQYIHWALELAKTAHAAFTYTPSYGSVKRMYWKMSIDLKRPLVRSMGHQDPLDGLVTYLQLEATAQQFPETESLPTLDQEIHDLQMMCHGQHWHTPDALGIGGLLTSTNKLIHLASHQPTLEALTPLGLLQDADISLKAFHADNQLDLPAHYRLAFRELGLAIGLQALEKMKHQLNQPACNAKEVDKLRELLDSLEHYQKLHLQIEKFWLDPEHQCVASWQDHSDINQVMLATCMAPGVYLR